MDTEYYSRGDVHLILWQNDLADDTERNIIDRVLTQYPIIQPDYTFIASFRETIAQKNPTGFIALSRYEQQRQNPSTKYFIQKLLSDLKPRVNAVVYTESNGFVERNVNRLKMLKRMMYGRAGFELLRQRMHYRTA